MTTDGAASGATPEGWRPVRLAYGREGLTALLPADAQVLAPTDLPGLDDAHGRIVAAVRDALERATVHPEGPVAIVFPDLTRPFPHRVVLPAVLEALAATGVDDGRIRLLCATGTHRQATDAEMRELVGDDLVDRFGVHDHDATDTAAHVQVGAIDGAPVLVDRAYVDAPTRIVTGFVEPHFFAGYSGGPKGVVPGLAATATVLEAHSPARIADPRATWTVLDGNPVHEFVRAAAALAPPALSVDVTINAARQVTAVFAGPLPDSHRQACDFVQRTSVVHLTEPFDVVVTTNAGHPLDRNLYQAVKGMSAAERVVRKGGEVVCVARCGDGLPDGDFAERLASAATPQELLDAPSAQDQWQVQVLGRVLTHARVGLHSTLPDPLVRLAQLEPVADVTAAVREAVRRAGPRVGVLPEGPLTVGLVEASGAGDPVG
ncbi:MAG TPA: nickel-dependent lactate racemase [Actinomycetales bacterium]|nr:nickel-dependent lactate racemase [Actinomycetales bacterium]